MQSTFLLETEKLFFKPGHAVNDVVAPVANLSRDTTDSRSEALVCVPTFSDAGIKFISTLIRDTRLPESVDEHLLHHHLQLGREEVLSGVERQTHDLHLHVCLTRLALLVQRLTRPILDGSISLGCEILWQAFKTDNAAETRESRQSFRQLRILPSLYHRLDDLLKTSKPRLRIDSGRSMYNDKQERLETPSGALISALSRHQSIDPGFQVRVDVKKIVRE
ncbi:nuclear import and export protein Msn5, partial [Aureobasidium melanogenum]